MSRFVLLIAVVAIASSCGVRRPLMKPKDIPAFEQKRKEKLEKLQVNPAKVDDVTDKKTTDDSVSTTEDDATPGAY